MDYQPNTNNAMHVEKVINQYSLPTMQTKLNRFVAFKEMTFTGEIPLTGRVEMKECLALSGVT